MHLDLVSLLVHDYDQAIEFYVAKLGFDLVQDSPALTGDGRPKRWVVIRPASGGTGILLARADGERQRSVLGHQFAGRVGMFLHVDDCAAEYARLVSVGVEFVRPPRRESYGMVAVFRDVSGNLWDLLGP